MKEKYRDGNKDILNKQEQLNEELATLSVERAELKKLKADRSEEHTSELQSRLHLVCRLLLEKKKKINKIK